MTSAKLMPEGENIFQEINPEAAELLQNFLEAVADADQALRGNNTSAAAKAIETARGFAERINGSERDIALRQVAALEERLPT